MKNAIDIFMLSKGPGVMVNDFAAFKFNQVAQIHAESYSSAEFRHGPLAMIDEATKTPTIFVVLDDDNIDQVMGNIL